MKICIEIDDARLRELTALQLQLDICNALVGQDEGPHVILTQMGNPKNPTKITVQIIVSFPNGEQDEQIVIVENPNDFSSMLNTIDEMCRPFAPSVDDPIRARLERVGPV